VPVSILAWPGAVAIGVSLGLLGSGGSILTVPVLVYLIVPALALLGGLSMHRAVATSLVIIALKSFSGFYSMHRAVATSLVIIALKSFSGFYKYLDVLDKQNLELDWQTLMLVTGLGIAGSFASAKIAHRVPHHKLKQGFGVFLIVMGIYILYRSLPEALAIAA
jgi:uncharacterized membrane protein YfcA